MAAPVHVGMLLLPLLVASVARLPRGRRETDAEQKLPNTHLF
jgi:hypothetical protein